MIHCFSDLSQAIFNESVGIKETYFKFFLTFSNNSHAKYLGSVGNKIAFKLTSGDGGDRYLFFIGDFSSQSAGMRQKWQFMKNTTFVL